MLMLTGLGSLQGAMYAGNQMNHIALAPRYAGTLYGLTNAAANACGFLAPYVIGSIVEGHVIIAYSLFQIYLSRYKYICMHLFFFCITGDSCTLAYSILDGSRNKHDY